MLKQELHWSTVSKELAGGTSYTGQILHSFATSLKDVQHLTAGMYRLDLRTPSSGLTSAGKRLHQMIWWFNRAFPAADPAAAPSKITLLRKRFTESQKWIRRSYNYQKQLTEGFIHGFTDVQPDLMFVPAKGKTSFDVATVSSALARVGKKYDIWDWNRGEFELIADKPQSLMADIQEALSRGTNYVAYNVVAVERTMYDPAYGLEKLFQLERALNLGTTRGKRLVVVCFNTSDEDYVEAKAFIRTYLKTWSKDPPLSDDHCPDRSVCAVPKYLHCD